MLDDSILADLSVRIEHASTYLAKMDLSIEGQRGNDKRFTAATALAHGFALPEETAVQMLLSEFNPRCLPPWSEQEIRRAVADAIKKPHQKPYGQLGRIGQKKGSPSRPSSFNKLAAKATSQPIRTPSNSGTTAMDFTEKMAGFRKNFESDRRDDTLIAKVFGIPAESLRSLGCLGMTSGVSKDEKGEDIFTGTLYWPEEDGNGNIIGIAYRNCQTNEKKVLTGGKRGITLLPGWDKRPGPLLVTEGFSDVAALRAAGLNAIARPSKSLAPNTAAGFLANALCRTDHQDIIILADKDDANESGNASKVASNLKEFFPDRSICWAILPNGAKDPREWITTQFEAVQPWNERGEAFLAGIARQEKKPAGEEDVWDDMPEPIPLGKLIETYPELRPVIIEGLLREGETMNVIAAPKTGKSWLVCDMALAIATGRDWLGKFATRQGKVLVIDNELHPETSANRFPLVGHARGITLEECQHEIEVCSLRGRLKPLDEMGGFFARIEPGKYQIIILDAMYRFQTPGASENDNGAMTQMYNALDQFAHVLKCGFVLVHHTSKGSQGDKNVVDVGSGAGSQSRAADTHLVLREHVEESCVVLAANVRSFAPVEPVGLRFSFPLWNVDEYLDVKKLKMPYRQGRRQQAKDEALEGFDDDRPKWTPEYLAEQIESYGLEGIGRESLIDLVEEGAGISRNKADKLVRRASEKNVDAIRNVAPAKNVPAVYVATRLLKSANTTALAHVEESVNVIPVTFKQNKE